MALTMSLKPEAQACMKGVLQPGEDQVPGLPSSLPSRSLRSSTSDLSETQCNTGFLSEIGTKLRDWAVGQGGGSCYSWAALSSNDSKTRYNSIKLKLHCFH